MAYPYKFVRKIFGVGIGVEALALEQPQTLPAVDGFTGARYRVRGQLEPQAPGFIKEGQLFQPVALRGNGLDLHGQFELQALADLTAGSKN